MTGEDAQKFMKKSLESAQKTRILLEDALRRNKDISKTTEEITNLLMNKLDKNFLPREIVSIVIGQMLRYLAKNQKNN